MQQPENPNRSGLYADRATFAPTLGEEHRSDRSRKKNDGRGVGHAESAEYGERVFPFRRVIMKAGKRNTRCSIADTRGRTANKGATLRFRHPPQLTVRGYLVDAAFIIRSIAGPPVRRNRQTRSAAKARKMMLRMVV